MGRRKIEIVRVKNSAARQVTFSKRRTGLFKKANEISILCGIEIAIVVVSPGNKCYSFGNPSVDGIASKFLQNAFNPNDVFEPSSYNIDDLNQQLDDLRVKMDEAEKESKIHDEILNKYKDVQLTQLKELKDSFVEFNDMVKSRICDFDIAESMMLLAKEPVIGIKYHVA